MIGLPTLKTKRLIIRPISIIDAEDMFEYAKTNLVGPDAGWAPHRSLNDTYNIISAMMQIKHPTELGNWAIVLKESGKMIGTIELYNHLPNFKAELGYALNPKFWGQGIIVEAAKEVIEFGFSILNLKRIHIGVFLTNNQSQRVAEKLGFIKEGILKNGYLRYDGKIFDELIYGLTDKEYYAHRKE